MAPASQKVNLQIELFKKYFAPEIVEQNILVYFSNKYSMNLTRVGFVYLKYTGLKHYDFEIKALPSTEQMVSLARHCLNPYYLGVADFIIFDIGVDADTLTEIIIADGDIELFKNMKK